jgi:hypothetical protein
MKYIEFALDGRELGRFPPPPGPAPEVFETTVALGDDNDALVGTRAGDGLKVWSLDRRERSGKAVELSGGKLAHGRPSASMATPLWRLTVCIFPEPQSPATLSPRRSDAKLTNGNRAILLSTVLLLASALISETHQSGR